MEVGGGRSKQQATNVSETARQASYNVIEQEIMQRHVSGLTNDDLRREAMMYVTAVIFYEGLLLMKRREILFGVDIQPPRFSLSHGVS